ncbi:MAG: cupin domain-containing protein [Mycobacteriales bacterium]
MPSSPPAMYIRIFADSEGETHFEDVLLPTGQGVMPGSTASDPTPVTSAIFRSVNDDIPGSHLAPVRQFVVLLSGEAEVTVSDGETRHFKPGDVLLADDTEGLGHITRTISGHPRRTLMITLDQGRTS